MWNDNVVRVWALYHRSVASFFVRLLGLTLSSIPRHSKGIDNEGEKNDCPKPGGSIDMKGGWIVRRLTVAFQANMGNF